MKKYIAGFICCLALIISLSFSQPVKADTWALPFDSLGYIVELIETVLSGGEVSFSEISSQIPVIGQVVNYLYEEQAAYKRGALTLQDWSDTIYNELVRLAREGYGEITPDCSLVIPIRAEDIAAFMRYDKYWYEQYAPDSIQFPNTVDTVNLGSILFGRNEISFSSIGYDTFNAYIGGQTYTGLHYPFAVRILDGQNYYYYVVGKDITPGTNNVYSSNGYWSGVTDPTYFPDFANFVYPYFTDIYQAIAFSYTGTLIGDAGFIGAPDVINVGNTGEDTYDVCPITDYDTLGFDIITFLDWLYNHDFETDPTIGLDDLIEDAPDVVVERDGTTRAIDDDDTIPVERVIVNELDVTLDPEPTGSPTTTPNPEIDDFPWIKFPIPPVPYQPDAEDEILAEIIQATDTVVPEPLMNVIWLCFGLLVTGGLIEILHK